MNACAVPLLFLSSPTRLVVWAFFRNDHKALPLLFPVVVDALVYVLSTDLQGSR